MKSYVFSKLAESDLVVIYRYGYKNYGKNKADSYQKSLKEKCNILADNPNISCERNEFMPPVRICHHNKHLIIYTIMKNDILIVRILHERMDITTYL